LKLVFVRGHPDFMQEYFKLKECDYLKHRVDEAMDRMKQNDNRGEKIEKTHWPKKYKKLGITNLFRYEITKRNYRLIYTIRSNTGTTTYQLLDFLAHPEYNKIFGYKD
jgi:mRNA-degrading endonuclease RelE of RelBE toxin-antitoxin system